MSTIKTYTPPAISNQPSSKIPSPKPSSTSPSSGTTKAPIDPPYDSKTAIREAASGATYLKSGTSGGDGKDSKLIGVA